MLRTGRARKSCVFTNAVHLKIFFLGTEFLHETGNIVLQIFVSVELAFHDIAQAGGCHIITHQLDSFLFVRLAKGAISNLLEALEEAVGKVEYTCFSIGDV